MSTPDKNILEAVKTLQALAVHLEKVDPLSGYFSPQFRGAVQRQLDQLEAFHPEALGKQPPKPKRTQAEERTLEAGRKVKATEKRLSDLKQKRLDFDNRKPIYGSGGLAIITPNPVTNEMINQTAEQLAQARATLAALSN